MWVGDPRDLVGVVSVLRGALVVGSPSHEGLDGSK